MVFVLDNYDSFTYNLVQYLGELGAEVEVYRNDELTVEQVEALNPERILLSPGPCTPQRGRHSGSAHSPHGRESRRFSASASAIRPSARPSAASVVRAQQPDARQNQPRGARRQGHLFRPAHAAHMHTLPLPDRAENLASRGPRNHRRTPEANGAGGSVIMGLRHRTLPIEGVQFHPESVLTEGGHQMIRNFLNM